MMKRCSLALNYWRSRIVLCQLSFCLRRTVRRVARPKREDRHGTNDSCRLMVNDHNRIELPLLEIFCLD